MIKIIERVATHQNCQDTLTLPFDLRQKARLHATLDSGEEVGLFLQRGQVLRGGDVLKTESGDYIQVCAAKEEVSTVTCDSAHLFSRACYHLGNRHVPLEISSDYLRYQHDHVLDDMLIQLGCEVSHEQAPFEPESGAYANANAHAHSHAHTHTHTHTHGNSDHSHDG